MKKGDEIDPKGLIADAYAIEGIGVEECRSILLDWALAVPVGVDLRALIGTLLARHAVEDHPMTQVLREGMEMPEHPVRRGGHRGRTSEGTA